MGGPDRHGGRHRLHCYNGRQRFRAFVRRPERTVGAKLDKRARHRFTGKNGKQYVPLLQANTIETVSESAKKRWWCLLP
jgi:hypothetical protein